MGIYNIYGKKWNISDNYRLFFTISPSKDTFSSQNNFIYTTNVSSCQQINQYDFLDNIEYQSRFKHNTTPLNLHTNVILFFKLEKR